MKKHYEKMCMTPLGFVFEGNLLQSSIVKEESVVKTMGQTVEDYDFSNGDEFNIEWE